MDCSDSYVILALEDDIWITGVFGDNWYPNMRRIDFSYNFNDDVDDDATVPVIDRISTVSNSEFRVMMTNGLVLSVSADGEIQIITKNAEGIIGSYYLTKKGEVYQHQLNSEKIFITDDIDFIFGNEDDPVFVTGKEAYDVELNLIVEAKHDIRYFSPTKVLYIDSNSKVYDNETQLKGSFDLYGANKILPFGNGEYVIFDNKGIVHFLGSSSNEALGIANHSKNNVIETPSIMENIIVFKGIIVGIDQNQRVWSISTVNKERIGWRPINEINRYYYPDDKL